LTRQIEKFVNDQLNLFKQNGIAVGRELVAQQVLDMTLNLKTKFIILTGEQLKQIANELSDRTIVQVTC
jgi:hypothetical protein